MSTYKQRAANRRNAQKSTGPKTEQGKARSKMNAVQHGLTAAQAVVIEGEDPEEFEAWCADYLATYRPRTPFARSLVIQLALESWHLQRVERLEGALTTGCQQVKRDEVEASFDEAYYKPLREEAERRCDESIEKKPDAPLIEKMDNHLFACLDGTYDSLFEKYFKEVKAEAKERGHNPPNVVLTAAELADVYQTGALNIFLNDKISDTLSKLNRYKTTCLNNMSRIFRLLEQEQKLTEVIDVSAPEANA